MTYCVKFKQILRYNSRIFYLHIKFELKFEKFVIRRLSQVKFDAESDGDTDLHGKPRKTSDSDLPQNIIILKNNYSKPIS